MILGDPIIRENLKRFLTLRQPAPKIVFEEFGVNNGRAIADVVALYKYAHCFEIKSDKDKLQRVLDQSRFFDQTFSKLTLVTTNKFAEKAIKLLPSYWGILVASSNNNGITFKYLKGANFNPVWNSKKSLLSLWKSEIINIGNNLNCPGLKDRLSLSGNNGTIH